MSARRHSTVLDLAVVGGGPAGASAALEAARRGLSVGLFEPQAMPADKPCGEGILPEGRSALERLGLGALLARGRPLERIRYVLESGRTLEIELPRPGLSLERHVLERALQEALAREPRIRLIPRRARTGRHDGGFLLTDGGEDWCARTLIAADGVQGDAASWLRRPRSPAVRHGLRARARAREPLSSVEVHLGRTCEVYLTPLPGERVNVAVLLDRLPPGREHSARALLEAALASHPLAAGRLGGLVTGPECRALSRARPRSVARAGAFLAGDAAGAVDPVLGCGVAIALCTGPAAARAAADVLEDGGGAPERAYRRFVARETHLRARLARGLVFLSAHPPLQEAVARAIGAAPPLGRALARAVSG